jgi:threonine dehydrogenase-like Zn-dependent dehydrogenase
MGILAQGELDLASLFDDSLRLEDWSEAFDRFVNQTGYKIGMRP